MSRYNAPIAASSLLALAVAVYVGSADSSLSAASVRPAVRLNYGAAQKLGNGTLRTYVLLDEKNGAVPLEVGVAMSEAAMEGLPSPNPHAHGGHDMHMYVLELPAQNPSPYKFVQFGWNPAGHEPATVYDLPHFDFHFWTVPQEVMESIVPTDSQYGAKGAKLPAEDERAPFFVDPMTLAKAPAEAVAVPQMGIHWLDVRAPELQAMAGNKDAFKPFTKTFIYGSWDGQFIFDEPMITRAHILAKRDATDPAVRDEIIPIPTPKRYAKPGYYPSAYRITFDSASKEYRVAMTQLAWRE